jgi:hypothetical protein
MGPLMAAVILLQVLMGTQTQRELKFLTLTAEE